VFRSYEKFGFIFLQVCKFQNFYLLLCLPPPSYYFSITILFVFYCTLLYYTTLYYTKLYFTHPKPRLKKGGSSATWVIANGAFPFLGCDPGKDFGTRVDPGRPELKCKVFINCKLRTIPAKSAFSGEMQLTE
jgi:hypothetical protein